MVLQGGVTSQGQKKKPFSLCKIIEKQQDPAGMQDDQVSQLKDVCELMFTGRGEVAMFVLRMHGCRVRRECFDNIVIFYERVSQLAASEISTTRRRGFYR
jgi:hypothetical protein